MTTTMTTTTTMRRLFLNRAWALAALAALSAGALALHATPARAAATAPDAFVREISKNLLDAVKADAAIQAGDIPKVIALVDAKLLPHLNFPRMTASAVGVRWRQASPEQRERLQSEFKTLLVRTYAGALAQVKPETDLHFMPLRMRPGDENVLVRSEVRGGGNEPIQLDYRLERHGESWRIYDVNVLGIWLVDQYRSSFAQEIATGGIDGLITRLAERNAAPASAPAGAAASAPSK
jgi:phospholipid transport system substrate-binding protein